jgi:hypothetical protein
LVGVDPPRRTRRIGRPVGLGHDVAIAQLSPKLACRGDFLRLTSKANSFFAIFEDDRELIGNETLELADILVVKCTLQRVGCLQRLRSFDLDDAIVECPEIRWRESSRISKSPLP